MTTTKTWNEIRPLADIAIRKGQLQPEFLEENDLTRSQWISIKPKGFNWRTIQKELGITIKYKTKEEDKPLFPIFDATTRQKEFADEILKEIPKHKACTRCGEPQYTEDNLCPPCKTALLTGILHLYRSGFSDHDICEILGE